MYSEGLDSDYLRTLQKIPEPDRTAKRLKLEGEGAQISPVDKVLLEMLLALENATLELSPERKRMLGLLLTRYDENLDKRLYTAKSAPKAEVEKWLRQDPTRLDTAIRWEARGGNPVFALEENRDFCITEASREVPDDIRYICYGPNAARQQGLAEDSNALTHAAILGGTLTTKWLRNQLYEAGLITDNSTWAWVLHPGNTDDTVLEDGTKVKGTALLEGSGGPRFNMHPANTYSAAGGLRCTLTGKRPEPSTTS